MAVEVGRGSQMLGLFLNGCPTQLDDRGDCKLLALSHWKDGLAVDWNAGGLWVKQAWTEVVGLGGKTSSSVLCVLHVRSLQHLCECGRQNNGPKMSCPKPKNL